MGCLYQEVFRVQQICTLVLLVPPVLEMSDLQYLQPANRFPTLSLHYSGSWPGSWKVHVRRSNFHMTAENAGLAQHVWLPNLPSKPGCAILYLSCYNLSPADWCSTNLISRLGALKANVYPAHTLWPVGRRSSTVHHKTFNTNFFLLETTFSNLYLPLTHYIFICIRTLVP